MEQIPADSYDSRRMSSHEFFIVKILNPFFGLENTDPSHPIVTDWMYTQVKKFPNRKSYLLNYKFPIDKTMSEKRRKKALIRGDMMAHNEIVNLANEADEIFTFSILNFTDIVSISSDITTLTNMWTPKQYAYIYV
jgi:hypothetical protein